MSVTPVNRDPSIPVAEKRIVPYTRAQAVCEIALPTILAVALLVTLAVIDFAVCPSFSSFLWRCSSSFIWGFYLGAGISVGLILSGLNAYNIRLHNAKAAQQADYLPPPYESLPTHNPAFTPS